MKSISIFILLFSLSGLSYSNSMINICDRGIIGEKIALQTGASSCSSVSTIEMADIEKLELKGELLGDIPSNAFEGLSNLLYLDLSNNEINSLPSGLFQGLSKLRILDLSSNGITSLPSGLFQDLAHVQVIALWDNQISSISADISF